MPTMHRHPSRTIEPTDKTWQVLADSPSRADGVSSAEERTYRRRTVIFMEEVRGGDVTAAAAAAAAADGVVGDGVVPMAYW